MDRRFEPGLSEDDHSDLTGTSASRVRKRDSCFTLDFSYIHGGSVRQSGSARYRQWMTHKLASWYDQVRNVRMRRLRPLHHLVSHRHRYNRGSCRNQVSPAARTEETNGGT